MREAANHGRYSTTTSAAAGSSARCGAVSARMGAAMRQGWKPPQERVADGHDATVLAGDGGEVVPHGPVVDDPGGRRGRVGVRGVQVQVEGEHLALQLAPLGPGVAGQEVLGVAEHVDGQGQRHEGRQHQGETQQRAAAARLRRRRGAERRHGWRARACTAPVADAAGASHGGVPSSHSAGAGSAAGAASAGARRVTDQMKPTSSSSRAAAMASAPDHLGGQRRAARRAGGEQPAEAPPVLRVAQHEVDAEHAPEGDEDVQGGDARLRDAQRVGGREDERQQRPGRRQAQPAGDGVDAGEQSDARDHAGQAPAEGPVAEQDDAHGDRHLAELRVRPRDLVAGLPQEGLLGLHAVVHDGLGVLGVVDLVEDVAGGLGEVPHAHAERGQQNHRHEQGVQLSPLTVRDAVQGYGEGLRGGLRVGRDGFAPV